MSFAFEVIQQVRDEEPSLFDDDLKRKIAMMVDEAVECEMIFAADVLSHGIAGLSLGEMRQYLQYVADQRLMALQLRPVYNVRNPFGFLELQDVQELANFFERRVSSYQHGVSGDVAFNEEF